MSAKRIVMPMHCMRGLSWIVVCTLAMIAVSTTPAECAERTPARATVSLNDADLARLDAIVGDARYVNIGEDSHGMPGVHQFVAEAFKHLVTHKGFRVFVFEAAWGLEDGLQDLLDSDRTEPQGDEDFFLNAFNSKSTLALLAWIREWNRTHPRDKIRLGGYQPEQPVTDFTALWRYLGALPAFATSGLQQRAAVCRAGSEQYHSNSEFLADAGKRLRAKQPFYGPSERTQCLAALAAIGQFFDAHREELIARSSENAFLEAKLSVLSLNTYVGHLTRMADEDFENKSRPVAEQFRLQGEMYMGGDQARYQVWTTLMQTRYAGKKIFFWMHNWHAAKHASELNRSNTTLVSIPYGTVSFGERLAREYGRELVTIGNVVPCDATCTEPEGSLEPAFEARFGQATTIIDPRHPMSETRGLLLSKPGWLYANHHKIPLSDVILDRQFDGLFYMSSAVAGDLKAERATQNNAAAADASRFVTVPDMAALAKRVVTAEGTLDPVYVGLVSGPSPYYSHLFGIQPIKDVSLERIKQDFVPRYAQLGAQTDHSLELKFPAGWTATFCTPCSIKFSPEIRDFVVPFSQVTFSGETFRDFEPHVREFRAILHARMLEPTYLIPNPIYDAELTVARRYAADAKATPVTADPQLKQFASAKDALLIYPDHHGDLDLYNRLMALLQTADFDWLALELMPSSVQAQADAFVTAPENSAAYREAREVLMRSIWNDRFVRGTPPEENHYLKILDLMRARKKRIIGLEGVPPEYFFFGKGEIEGDGAAARNVLWVEHLPQSGRGILFGGSAHFTGRWPVNVQDFLGDRLPNMQILSIVPIKLSSMAE